MILDDRVRYFRTLAPECKCLATWRLELHWWFSLKRCRNKFDIVGIMFVPSKNFYFRNQNNRSSRHTKCENCISEIIEDYWNHKKHIHDCKAIFYIFLLDDFYINTLCFYIFTWEHVQPTVYQFCINIGNSMLSENVNKFRGFKQHPLPSSKSRYRPCNMDTLLVTWHDTGRLYTSLKNTPWRPSDQMIAQAPLKQLFRVLEK